MGERDRRADGRPQREVAKPVVQVDGRCQRTRADHVHIPVPVQVGHVAPEAEPTRLCRAEDACTQAGQPVPFDLHIRDTIVVDIHQAERWIRAIGPGPQDHARSEQACS